MQMLVRFLMLLPHSLLIFFYRVCLNAHLVNEYLLPAVERRRNVTEISLKSQFGLPEYNYFWIENESKTDSKLSYYYNYKSNSVVWQRPCPKDVPLPFYKKTWGYVEPNLSGNDEDAMVSDPENEVQRRKRINVRQRNKRLMEEELRNAIEIVQVKRVIKSRRALDTFWKLYRLPGESLMDVKKRLLDSSAFAVRVKEEMPDVENCNGDTLMTSIKQEPSFNNLDYSIHDQSHDQTIKTLHEDSDSDPENVSYLIKQEYLTNYNVEDSEEEYAKQIEEYENEVPEEYKKDKNNESEIESEDTTESEDDHQHEVYGEVNPPANSNNSLKTQEEREQDEIDYFEYTYEAPWLFTDLFEVEIDEDDRENIFEPPETLVENSLPEQDVNWNFETTSRNPAFTQSLLDSIYGAPKLKELTSKGLQFKKKNKTKCNRKKAAMKKIKIEPAEVVQPVAVEDPNTQGIVCDMYGTRTVNYNYPPTIKMSKGREITKLSDSSDSEYEPPIRKIKQEVVSPNEDSSSNVPMPTPAAEKNDNNPLKLTSWFPSRKRKANTGNSDESWHGSNASEMDSDLEEFDQKSRIRYMKIKKEKGLPEPPIPKSTMKQIKIKREKLSPEPENNEASYSRPPDNSLAIAIGSIKREVRSRSSSWEAKESEMPESMTSTLLLDSSVAKIPLRASMR
ncbi:hypothetical protein TSAR_005356 [Trichomalopsis sarcophagae]|uniref:WW domain-containing protein n=1 Tax=Trichomalopsis sarcophagae TaxID=543379 RepID=A0A232EKU2_9HYME|nr:hypothetical protein TSAR_005356 [Trichomalopsis sarcophagae]